jgi:hypothetical protein
MLKENRVAVTIWILTSDRNISNFTMSYEIKIGAKNFLNIFIARLIN